MIYFYSVYNMIYFYSEALVKFMLLFISGLRAMIYKWHPLLSNKLEKTISFWSVNYTVIYTAWKYNVIYILLLGYNKKTF